MARSRTGGTKLSRSKVEFFLGCPRCFWLDQVKGVKQPSGYPFNLNIAVDHLLKNEFDQYRGGTEVPPRLAREGLAFIPSNHPEIGAWRENFKGVRVLHEPTGITFFGAIDDLWVDGKGVHYVADYKATSKASEVSLEADWQDGYKRQVEFYQWLLRARGLEVSDTAWFVYANGIKDEAPFDDVLRFRTKIIPYEGSDEWVEPTLLEISECLALESAPESGDGCEYCRFVELAKVW